MRPRYEIVDDQPPIKSRYELVDESATPADTTQSTASGSSYDKLPWMLRQALNIAPSLVKPAREAIPERLSAAGQGAREIGQGAKQLYLNRFGNPGEEGNYNKQVEAQRQAYGQTPAGQDPYANLIKSGVTSAPEIAALGPLGMEGMFAKMVGTGSAMGIAKGTEFVPEGGSRRINMLKGATEGAALPLIGPALDTAAAGAEFIGKNIKDIPNILTKPFTNLAPLEKQAAESKLAAENAAESHTTAKENYGSAAANEKKVFNHQQKLQDLYGQLAEKPHEIPANPAASEENLVRSQVVHEEANKVANDVDQNISQHLNEGSQHDVRVATGVFDKAESERKALGAGYKALEKDFEQRQVPLNNVEAIQNKTNEMHELIKGGQARSPEMDKVLKELDTLKEQTPSNAKDYLHTLQSVKDYARKAREKAYSYGMNKEERLAHESTFNELDAKAEEMSKILEDSVGPEDAQRLKDLNTGWRERVVPLQRNPIYQRIRHKEQMPADIIGALRGSKDKGNQLIKEHIQSDPELLKNAVGQRYAAKPEKLMKAGETAKEYIGKMPELQQLLEHRNNAQSAIPLAKQKMEETALTHKEVQASHEANIKSNAKRSAIHQEISDIQEKLPSLDKTIQDLRKKQTEKKVTLQEKMKNEAALEKAKQVKEHYWKRFKVLSGLVGTTVLGYKAKRFGSALLNKTEIENPGEAK